MLSNGTNIVTSTELWFLIPLFYLKCRGVHVITPIFSTAMKNVYMIICCPRVSHDIDINIYFDLKIGIN